ncbi:hypothetical protein NDU88_001683 [Pleurodeles waltl]|uniref:Uncharacterized protein n=1 Tax=Pleurodeles waltl TaxID=8319 RepID=A0AAV7MKG4_PLEWA|nr:hypothetical protein NDU88_001683 [Pleurodeles waltl]
MYRPHYYKPPVCHLFRGGYTVKKKTAETGLGRENAHLNTSQEEPGRHGTGTLDSSSHYLPAPLPGARTPAAKTTRQNHWRSLACGAAGGGVLGSGDGGGGVLGSIAAGGGVLGSGSVAGGVLGSGAGGGGVLRSSAAGGGAQAAGSWAAGLVAVVSWAAVLLVAVSWAAGLVPVLSAVQIFPDLLVLLCPFPTLDGGAAVSTPPTVPLGAALVADFFPLSRQALANFLCFTGGGLSLPWLLATLAALLPGALQKPVTTGTTGPADVVAEVLGWDLESRALGD